MSETAKGDLYLLCRIGATSVAFPAAAIEAVVKATSIVAIPGAPAAVRGLAAIRSRLLTVIDCAFIVDRPHGADGFMAIITVSGHGYGLLLEDVIDVVELEAVQPLPCSPQPAWQKLQPMLADYAGEPVLVIDSDRFIDIPQRNLSQAA